jgi:uncharacterized membrane protein
MNITLWILQGLLAVAFFMAGTMKLVQPKTKLAERMGWVNDFTGTQLKLIGFVEVLGALGLILPMVTGILPWLTPLAAAGLAINQYVASTVHARRGNEQQMQHMNYVLALFAIVIAVGRFFLPIA